MCAGRSYTTSRYPTIWVHSMETRDSYLYISLPLNLRKSHHRIYQTLVINTPLIWWSINTQRQNDCVFDTMKTESCFIWYHNEICASVDIEKQKSLFNWPIIIETGTTPIQYRIYKSWGVICTTESSFIYIPSTETC